MGAGFGVLGVGYLLGGEARTGAVMAGALAGFFPEPSRVIAPGRDDAPKDEYVRVLPMLTPTPKGGVVGGLVGRF